MSKLVGAVLIIFVGIMLGRKGAERLERRCRMLFGLQQGLLSLANQIGYGAVLLADAAEQAALSAASAQPLFEQLAYRLRDGDGHTAGELWQEVLAANDDEIDSRDLAILLTLAADLGTTGRDEQLQRLELCRLRLAAQEEQAVLDSVRFGKIWRSMGLGLGVVTVLLFV